MRSRLRNLYGRIAGRIWLLRFTRWSRSLERMDDTVPWTWLDDPELRPIDRERADAWLLARHDYVESQLNGPLRPADLPDGMEIRFNREPREP